MTAPQQVSISIGGLEGAVNADSAATGGGPYNSVVLSVNGPNFSPMELAKIAVTEDAVITATIPKGTTCDINTAFLLAGFQARSEKVCKDGSRVVTASKVQIVTAKAVQLKENGKQQKVVSISLDDDDDDIVDEDDLLKDEGVFAPDMNAKVKESDDDCGGRAPCDDCTCGRADAENVATQQQRQQKPIETSACGKCSLGDAFRCASCPYLGKPAFKAGEEHLVLDMQDDF